MKIARLVAPRKFEFETVTDPVMGKNESIIELERWSICGTDIRSAYGQELSKDKLSKTTDSVEKQDIEKQVKV